MSGSARTAHIFRELRSYDLYPGNNDSTEGITLVLVGIYDRNKLVWVEVERED